MGHGYKDGLILWLVAWLIRLHLAADTMDMDHIKQVLQRPVVMPDAHIGIAHTIADAVTNLHPRAQRTMVNVLLGLPTKKGA